jgi:hypothetical protein
MTISSTLKKNSQVQEKNKELEKENRELRLALKAVFFGEMALQRGGTRTLEKFLSAKKLI